MEVLKGLLLNNFSLVRICSFGKDGFLSFSTLGGNSVLKGMIFNIFDFGVVEWP